MRTTMSRTSVKTTRFRSSGILKVLVKAEIIASAGQPAFSMGDAAVSPLSRHAKSRRHLLESQRAARLLHRGLRRFARLVHGNRELLLELAAAAEDLDRVIRSPDQSRCEQHLLVHSRAVVEGIQCIEIDDGEARLERIVVEAALWDAPDQWHLTSFESQADAAARARLLPFVALAGLFAVAAAFGASEPLDPMRRSRTWFESVQVHGLGLRRVLPEGNSARLVNLLAQPKLLQRAYGRLDDIRVVARSERL